MDYTIDTFDWIYYIESNRQLRRSRKYGTQEKAWEHWITKGCKQCRRHRKLIRPKLYTIMVGGLGNQLFMFFNLLSLSKKYNMDFNVCFDKNYKKHHSSQKYSLFKNIKFNKLSKEELKDYEIYNESSFIYNQIILDNKKNYFLKGYFQSYKYFWEYQDEIKKYIYIDNDKINKIKKIFSSYGKKILSIHLRLGDYIEYKEIHYNTSIEYYQNALSKYNLDKYQIILFSDNSKLADEKFKPLNINYIKADDLFIDDEDQFFMLLLSDVKICSASTFSLMSCYLNDIFKFVDDSKYIFPEKWFDFRGPKYNYNDLIDFTNLKYDLEYVNKDVNMIKNSVDTNMIKYLIDNNRNNSEVNNNLLFTRWDAHIRAIVHSELLAVAKSKALQYGAAESKTNDTVLGFAGGGECKGQEHPIAVRESGRSFINIIKYLTDNNRNNSKVNNNLLFVLNNKNVNNINFFIKCITLLDFGKYNIYLYSENDDDKRIDLIKNNFKNVNLLTDFQITCSIVILENNKYINNFLKFNKFIKYFVYCKTKTEIKLLNNSITYITCLDLNIHLQNIPILNIDDQSSHILKKNDHDKLELVKIKKSNNFENYFYVNSYILTYINIPKSDKVLNNEILLKEIVDKNYYSPDGIIKYNNLFYYKIGNKIEEININNIIYKLNSKIDCIYYDNVENIDNLITESNLQLHFTILILSYNNSKFVDINLKSALNQKYNNFDVIYINCQSTDNTAELAYNIGKKYDNFYLFNNIKRCYQTENFILGSLTAKKNSIIVSLDGDDWLYDDNVLSKLNMIYLSKRCLMTYGLYVECPYREVNFARTDKINYIKENKFRENKQSVSHLRTWKRELIININYDDLLYYNEFPKMAGDISILTYMIEMSYDRACFVRDRLYVYNLLNENSDHNTDINMQTDIADYFFNKKPYNKINNFNKIIELDKINKTFIESNFKNNVIINKLLELNYEDKISSYKHLFYNFYFFKHQNWDNIKLLHYETPVLSNNISVNLDLDLNAMKEYYLLKDKKLSNYSFNENLEWSLKQNKIYDYMKNYFVNNKINFNNIDFYKKFFINNADVNIIIPVQNRKENFECLIKNLLSIDKNKHTIMISVVEMNDNKHKKFSEENKINYLSFYTDLYKFNKSLCGNFLHYIYEINSINYKYLIFHDVDCLVNKDFIKNIFEFNDYENKFIQPYKKNRVLYTEEKIAKNIRENIIKIDKIDESTEGIIEPGRGAPGGSIFMKKEFFENVGGLDYYFFSGYGPEDIFFYVKLLTLYKNDNNNFSNIIHLWHESIHTTENANNFKFYNLYIYLDIANKKKLLNLFKNHLLFNN